MRTLIAIPVYNEERYVSGVLSHVLGYADEVLVIDDGSTDRTPTLVSRFPVEVIRHSVNRGYGRSMRDAFAWASVNRFDWVITMDCDEQHEPASIPVFRRESERIGDGAADVISGSRYMAGAEESEGSPPADRRGINLAMTEEINRRLRLSLTDSFCGFKAYRVESLRRLRLDEDGYAFPMQFWVQAVAHGLRIREVPVRLIYNDPNRSFGGCLDDPSVRLKHYRRVLHCELARCADRLPRSAVRCLEEAGGCGA
ncbi:MAG: glycosyltransferase family 2 protein [Phycisphaerales bacterium]